MVMSGTTSLAAGYPAIHWSDQNRLARLALGPQRFVLLRLAGQSLLRTLVRCDQALQEAGAAVSTEWR